MLLISYRIGFPKKPLVAGLIKTPESTDERMESPLTRDLEVHHLRTLVAYNIVGTVGGLPCQSEKFHASCTSLHAQRIDILQRRRLVVSAICTLSICRGDFTASNYLFELCSSLCNMPKFDI